MVYPPVWMWVIAVSMVVGGLWLSRARSARRYEKRVRQLPTWFCALLALAALVGMWYLLQAQFGGLVVQVRLP
jgi:uncharacterized membrane protein